MGGRGNPGPFTRKIFIYIRVGLISLAAVCLDVWYWTLCCVCCDSLYIAYIQSKAEPRGRRQSSIDPSLWEGGRNGWDRVGGKDYQNGPCNSECNEPNDVSGRKLDGSTTVPDFLLFFFCSFSFLLLLLLLSRIRVFDGLLTHSSERIVSSSSLLCPVAHSYCVCIQRLHPLFDCWLFV